MGKSFAMKIQDENGKASKEQKKFKDSSLFEDNNEENAVEEEEEDTFDNIISKVRSHKCEKKFRVQRVLNTKKITIPNHREIAKREKQKLKDESNGNENSIKNRNIRPTSNVPTPNWSSSASRAGPRGISKKSGRGFTPFTSFV